MDKKPIDFTERAQKEGVGVAPITDLLMTTFEITDVRVNKGLEYDTAVITVKNGDKYRTSSDVLMEQLLAIDEWLANAPDATVKVSLKQVGRYYTF